MSTLTHSFGRVLVATGAAIALGSISILGASAAHADSGFGANDDTLSQRVFDVNKGSIIVRLPGDAYANATVVVISQLPTKDSGYAQSAAVKPEADTDGYYAKIDNLAGPVFININNGSAVGTLAVGDDDAADADAPDAAIYRAATAVYDFDPATGDYNLEGSAPVSPVPDSADLDYLIPVTTYTFTPTSYEKGKSFTIKFRDIVAVWEDERVGKDQPRLVSFYGYSAPNLISTASIVNGEVDFVVPAAYTTEPHDIVAFDEFGRANLAVSLDGGTTAPVGPTKPALANTGAGDPTGPLALSAGVLAFGAAAIAGAAILRRRTVTAPQHVLLVGWREDND